jgi:phosphoglycolate phosphatase
MRVAAFDLDGALADTAADLIGALNDLAALERGLAPIPLDERPTAGKGGRALIRRGMEAAGAAADEARVDALFPLYLDLYEARITRETRLYPDAEACLDALAAEGWRLAICTNKPERLARRLLEALGVAGRFHAILGADTLPVRKPDPLHLIETIARAGGARERAFLLGDTRTDRECARRAGVPCALVSHGYADVPLEALAPEAVIGGLSELPGLAPRLIGEAPPLDAVRRRA